MRQFSFGRRGQKKNKVSLGRRAFDAIARVFGLHPDVSGLISNSVKLANPRQAALPVENLPMASRVFANGLWNFSFYQFYPAFSGPYWVHRQYDLRDPAFIPRAGSMLSVNLTHRNWMGVRSPEGEDFGIVDPAGSLSPVVGYYSLEFGLRIGDRIFLAPRGDFEIEQKLLRQGPIPRTIFRLKNEFGDFQADWTVAGSSENAEITHSQIRYSFNSRTDEPAHIVIGVRPFHVEGAALLHRIEYEPNHRGAGGTGGVIAVNGQREIHFLDSPERIHMSNLQTGDAYFTGQAWIDAYCDLGVATAALHFPLAESRGKRVKGEVVFFARTYEREFDSRNDQVLLNNMLSNAERRSRGMRTRRPPRTKYVFEETKVRRLKNLESETIFDPRRRLQLKSSVVTGGIDRSRRRWRQLLERGAVFRCARETWNEAARAMKGHVLSLQTGDMVTPGVFTYRLFWFRDAAYMVSALANWNFLEEAGRVVRSYPGRIDRNGFFRSQEGEWDSNGQAIWTLAHFADLSGDAGFLREVFSLMTHGCEWIVHKRSEGFGGKLMPAGWSAEHLGPADYYYWDNFWSLAGLRDTAAAARRLGNESAALRFQREYETYRMDLLTYAQADLQRMGALPAGPGGRGVDGGMIGNPALLYPLELDLLSPEELRATLDVIHANFFPEGLFFQPIIHSGYNIYLSLHVAQGYLRLGDVRRAREILKKVIKTRRPLWTYPEAVHPRTGGGCMGDGFHGWAFAELLMMLRELTLRRVGDTLHIFPGLRERELYGADLEFGPFPVSGGFRARIRGRLEASKGELEIELPGVHTANDLSYVDVHLSALKKKPGKIRVEGARLAESPSGIARLMQPGDRLRLSYGG